MFDGKAFGEEMVAIVRGYVERQMAPILAENVEIKARIAELEARQPQKGEPGRDADPELIEVAVAEAVAKAVAELPAPKNGEAGRDADPAVMQRMVLDAVAAMPAPRDGKDADPALIDLAVADAVARAVAELPVPKDGASVTVDDIRPLVDETVAVAVAALPSAKDGVGLARGLIDRDGNLVLTMTDGAVCELGRVVGKDVDMDVVQRLVRESLAAIPVPKDGKDGFSLDDFDATLMDDGRTVLLSFERDDVRETYEMSFPVVLDRGVYQAGKDYAAGDAVTWAGSLWIAQKETDAKPDAADGSWRLAVKRGRDGKDAS